MSTGASLPNPALIIAKPTDTHTRLSGGLRVGLMAQLEQGKHWPGAPATFDRIESFPRMPGLACHPPLQAASLAGGCDGANFAFWGL
ncbi:hypothetical protein MY1884_000520 [Beauveria asiatica]